MAPLANGRARLPPTTATPASAAIASPGTPRPSASSTTTATRPVIVGTILTSLAMPTRWPGSGAHDDSVKGPRGRCTHNRTPAVYNLLTYLHLPVGEPPP